ncbi:MAG: DUF4105 domain-containing protein [Thermodesulfobacteriota bacterium]
MVFLLRCMWVSARIVLSFAWLAAGLWGGLAWYYNGSGPEALRLAAASLFTLLALAGVAAPSSWRWPIRSLFVTLFLALLFWYHSLSPSNEREWQKDVARQAWAERSDDIITIHNVRNSRYRSESDYDVVYEDREYRLSSLEGVDLAAVYWMGPHIAHVMVSFAFAEGGHLAFSIETRKEPGESYSTLAGFFRQYELIYIAGDESDLFGVRTNHRHNPPESVYLYRLQAPLEAGRRFFLAYLERINEVHHKAEWYNSLTSNCTTNMWLHSRVNPGHLPFTWKILASGHVPKLLYETGRLDQTLPFPILQEGALINEKAKAAGEGADFSRLIRLELPATVNQ